MASGGTANDVVCSSDAADHGSIDAAGASAASGACHDAAAGAVLSAAGAAALLALGALDGPSLLIPSGGRRVANDVKNVRIDCVEYGRFFAALMTSCEMSAMRGMLECAPRSSAAIRSAYDLSSGFFSARWR